MIDLLSVKLKVSHLKTDMSYLNYQPTFSTRMIEGTLAVACFFVKVDLLCVLALTLKLFPQRCLLFSDMIVSLSFNFTVNEV